MNGKTPDCGADISIHLSVLSALDCMVGAKILSLEIVG
jgi:hypothetical protein